MDLKHEEVLQILGEPQGLNHPDQRAHGAPAGVLERLDCTDRDPGTQGKLGLLEALREPRRLQTLRKHLRDLVGRCKFKVWICCCYHE